MFEQKYIVPFIYVDMITVMFWLKIFVFVLSRSQV